MRYDFDYPPGLFTSTKVFADSRDPLAVLAAMRAGNMYTCLGGLIESLQCYVHDGVRAVPMGGRSERNKRCGATVACRAAQAGESLRLCQQSAPGQIAHQGRAEAFAADPADQQCAVMIMWQYGCHVAVWMRDSTGPVSWAASFFLAWLAAHRLANAGNSASRRRRSAPDGVTT